MTCSLFSHFFGIKCLPVCFGWKVDLSTLFAFGMCGVCSAHAIIACLHAVACFLSRYICLFIVCLLWRRLCWQRAAAPNLPWQPRCCTSAAPPAAAAALLLCCCCCPPVSLKRISYFPKQDFSATFSCISRLIRYLGQFVLSLGETQQENLLRGGFLLGVRWSCAFAENDFSSTLSVFLFLLLIYLQ